MTLPADVALVGRFRDDEATPPPPPMAVTRRCDELLAAPTASTFFAAPGLDEDIEGGLAGGIAARQRLLAASCCRLVSYAE